MRKPVSVLLLLAGWVMLGGRCCGESATTPDEGRAPALVEEWQHTTTGTVAWLVGAVEEHVGAWGRHPILGVEVWRYGGLLVLLLATFLVARLGRWILETYAARLAARSKWRVDDLVFQHAGAPLSVLTQAMGIYLAGMFLLVGHAPIGVQRYFARICSGIAAGAVLWYLYLLVDIVDLYLRRIAARTDNQLDDSIADVLRKTLRVFLVAVGGMVIAKNILHWDVTAVLASAGILGLAVAFAAQDTIANFFGTIMLLLDRPFRVGERVRLDGADGPVESIGFRSTRIRTLDGHQVTIPNKQVANSAVENVGRRPHIKRVSNITITYDTPITKVERAVDIIRSVLAGHSGMDPEFPPRVFFNEFNDCSLNIVMIAWYHPADYWQYLEWCQEVNLAIMRQFEAEGIEFAFPTTTTYLAQDNRRPLEIRTTADRQTS